MASETQLQQNRELMVSFLENRPIPKEYCIPPEEFPFGYIYCIENKISGKKYFGSTYSMWVGVARPRPMHVLKKRAVMYLYEYNRALKNKTNGVIKTYRPIIQAMLDEGFGNFIMYPVAETTRQTHINAETYFILKYNTIKNGYNVDLPVNLRRLGGNKMREEEKKLRATAIICVNMNMKRLVFADSMKLFADAVGTSKDMIKNANRKGMPYKGWFVFYRDESKRKSILVNNVLNDQDKRQQDRHSDSAKKFYSELCRSVGEYLNGVPNENKEYFPDFEVMPEISYQVDG